MRRSRSAKANTSRRLPKWPTTSSSACVSIARCATPRARCTGWTPDSSGRPRSPWRSATTSIRATRARRSVWTSCRTLKASGDAPLSASVPESAPSTWTRRAPSSVTRSPRSLIGRLGSSCRKRRTQRKPRSRSDEHSRQACSQRIPSSLVPPQDRHLLVAGKLALHALHRARADQRARGLVRGADHRAGCCHRERPQRLRPLLRVDEGTAHGVRERAGLRVPAVSLHHLVQPGAQGDGGEAGRSSRAGHLDRGRELRWMVRGIHRHRLAGDVELEKMKRLEEPFFWGLFSAGGVFSAMFLPIQALLFALLIPLGIIHPSYEHLHTLLANPITRLYLVVLCSLSLFHWAHRF